MVTWPTCNPTVARKASMYSTVMVTSEGLELVSLETTKTNAKVVKPLLGSVCKGVVVTLFRAAEAAT